jgi:hypothetical protein
VKLSCTVSESITPNDKPSALETYKSGENPRLSLPKIKVEKFKLKLDEKASDDVNVTVELKRSDGENVPLGPNEFDGLKIALAEQEPVN